MLLPTLIAALVALPIISAQNTTAVSQTATRCTTRFGFYPLPTGDAGAPTWYSFTRTTSQYRQTTTVRDTVTVTPSATTSTNVVTTSVTITSTSTSFPAPTTIPTSNGFLPLIVADVAAPTPMPRIKRFELDARNAALIHPLKRQTLPGNSGGFIAYPNGTYSGLYRRFPHRVDCHVTVTVDETVVEVVQGAPETITALQPTATSVETVTESTTTTVTEVAPQSTVYAACARNNVVNEITDIDGNTMVFDRVIFRPSEGFPVTNELVVNTTSEITCCVTCQNTPYCAGSFYAPSISECHLQLTQPFTPSPPTLPSSRPDPSASLFPHNGTYPTATASGALVPISTGRPDGGNGTCARGSLSLYLGAVRGQSGFPRAFALSISNGPCGRWTVSPIPVRVPQAAVDGGDVGGEGTVGRRWLGM